MRAVAIRLKFPRVQTAVIEMKHSTTGHTATLVAMCHQSTQEYFALMRAEVELLLERGTTVFSEAAQIDKDGICTESADAMRKAMNKDTFDNGLTSQDREFQLSGLVDCDAPFEGSERTLAEVSRVMNSMAKHAGVPHGRADEVFTVLVQCWVAPLLNRLTPVGRAIVGNRDKHVVRTVQKSFAEQPKDFGIVYGAMHMNGIMRGLKRMGYRRVGIRWVTAFEI